MPGTLPPAILAVLAQRGMSSAELAADFLEPKLKNLSDPFKLPGMDAAVSLILEALEKQLPVVIFGDYDVDGVTSTACLTLFLRELGFQSVTPFLPNRMDEGYGMSQQAVERCLDAHRAGLFIAVDCGTNSVEEAKRVKEQGADVIVLDHHEVQEDLPKSVFSALVNPKLTGEYDYLCSVGIVFKLAHAILKKMISLSGKQADQARGIDLKSYLDLVAVGTVADIVPLLGDNRIMVSAGLKVLSASQRPGMIALKEVCGIHQEMDTYQIGFMMGPRLNAMGRLESAMKSLDLLLCEDAQRSRSLAVELDTMNRERQAVEAEIFEQALEDARSLLAAKPRCSLVLGRAEWHVGVVGIVASRILREYHLPTIVVGFDAEGRGKGSGRSIEGFDLVDALNACSEYLEKFGGHAMAAGITIEHGRLETFREAFDREARAHLNDDLLMPRLKIDARLGFDQITPGFLEALARIEPFGNANPEPLFIAQDVAVTRERRMGSENQHLKLQLQQGGQVFEGVYFRYGADVLIPSERLDIAFIPEWNHFRGSKTIQLKLKAIREHQPESIQFP